MGDEFNSSQPIYQQLVQRVCRQIARGELKPGDKLPSVREMAVQSGVNPNTVQRVYSELERLAVVETRRGQGTFVTEDQTQLVQMRRELLQEKLRDFVHDMREMGCTVEEMIEGLKAHLQEEAK